MATKINYQTCHKCLKERAPEEFLPHQNRGRWCTQCYKAYYKTYNKKRYTTPEERQNELERQRVKYANGIKQAREQRKRQLIEMMGGKCSICSYRRSSAALDFDHLDEQGQPAKTKSGNPNKNKRRTISHLLAISAPWGWDAAVEEAKRCRLLCSNCHREQTLPGHEMETEAFVPESEDQNAISKTLAAAKSIATRSSTCDDTVCATSVIP